MNEKKVYLVQYEDIIHYISALNPFHAKLLFIKIQRKNKQIKISVEYLIEYYMKYYKTYPQYQKIRTYTLVPPYLDMIKITKKMMDSSYHKLYDDIINEFIDKGEPDVNLQKFLNTDSGLLFYLEYHKNDITAIEEEPKVIKEITIFTLKYIKKRIHNIEYKYILNLLFSHTNIKVNTS